MNDDTADPERGALSPGGSPGAEDPGQTKAIHAESIDSLLVERTRAGDRAAFGELVNRHMKRAFAIAYRILHDRQDAEDVVQDAFVAALGGIDSFDTTRPFGPWLGTIVVRKGLNALAKRRVRAGEPLTADLAASGDTPDEEAARAQLAGRVRSTLLALPPRQRVLIELIELEGFTAAEAAEALEIAPATARWHLHVARARLREALAPLHRG